MFTDINQRRIPKRRDWFNNSYVFYFLILALFLIVRFFPISKDIIPFDLIWFIILGGFFISIGLNLYEWKFWHIKWRNFASNMGLLYESYEPKQAFMFKWPRISGIYHGNPILIERFTRGHGRSTRNYTLINISLRDSISEVMEISSRSWTSGIRRSISREKSELHYIKLGDELFDKRLEVKNSSDPLVRNVLAAYNIRQGLIEIAPQAKDMKIIIEGRELHYEERSNIMDKDYLVAVVNTLIEIAGYVERYGTKVRMDNSNEG